jgi:hypothetical protein
MSEETRALIEYVKTLSEQERGTFVTWLIIDLIKDISYYIVVGLVVWALGRRLIQAIMAGMREARRDRA